MENTRGLIKKLIQEAVTGLGIDAPSFSLEQPEDLGKGDLATNVAFAISKQLQTSPKEAGEKVVGILNDRKGESIEKIEIAGPGFINFFLTDAAIRNDVQNIEDISTFQTKYSGKKVLVEHSSPNLFKPFSVGHLMNNFTGEAIVQMMKSGGAEVSTMAFPSDISLGIAKAIYIIKLEEDKFEEVLQKNKEEIVTYLGKSYVGGVAHYEKYPDLQGEIKNIAQNLYSKTESKELEIYEKAKKFNMEYFTSLMDSLDSHFDDFYYESQAGNLGKEIVLKYTPEVFTKSEGAIVYIPPEERKDLNTLVFINSQGNPTYEAKDIGLLSYKFEKFDPDCSLFVTDSEQTTHFKVVLAAAEKIEKKWAEKSQHIPHGRMTFKGEKMSSRLGGVPLAVDVINTVMEEVKNIGSEKLHGLEESEKEKVYKQVAMSALKFSVLRSKLGSNINFDPESSLSFEGDSGPYVQYTYARACSLLRKGKEAGFIAKYDDSAKITDLERKLLNFQNIATRAIEEISPQLIVTFLFELSQLFNNFYATTPIIVEGDEATKHRLAIVASVANVLKKSLEMIGVEAPERM
jgi:arginyl-tRNA synthetase